MNNYIKLDLKVLEEIGDIRQAVIICFLLNQNKEIDKVKIQVWKKEYLSKMLCVSLKTIYNDLNKLKSDGYLDYERVYNLKIELTDKTLKWFGETTQQNIKTYHTQSNNHKDNTSQIILSTQKEKELSIKDRYLKSIEENL